MYNVLYNHVYKQNIFTYTYIIHVYLYKDLYDHFSNVENKIFNTILLSLYSQ